MVTLVCWLLPLVAWQAFQNLPAARRLPLLMAAAAAVVIAAALRRLIARYRHGSQAFRLALLTLPLVAPAFAFYPTVVQLAGQAKTELVETTYATEVRSQRQTVQSQMLLSELEIDRFDGYRYYHYYKSYYSDKTKGQDGNGEGSGIMKFLKRKKK